MRWGLPFVVSLLHLGVFACGADDPGSESVCLEEVTFSMLRTAVLETHCLECHSSAVQGTARQGAPGALNFDAYDPDDAPALANAITSGAMPPPDRPRLSVEERALASTWRRCGFRP